MPKSGRPPKLDREQWPELKRLVLSGPRACGYPRDLWTLPLVRELVLDRFGVSYHEAHLALATAGIHRARGLIAAVGTDAENVFTVLTARVMRPDLFIIARVESDDAEHKLRRAGADRVISPYQIGANHMVQTALRPAVVDFVHLATSSERLDLSMEQVHIREDSALANHSIVDAGIRQRFGVIVVGIKRAGGAMEFNPPPEAMMRAGDELVVLGRTDSVKALEKDKGVVA